jgi:leucyl aminopeptidase
MQIASFDYSTKRDKADALILPFWKANQEAVPACSLKEYESLYELPIKNRDFKGSLNEILFLYPSNALEPRLILLGLGSQIEASEENLRKTYAALVKACRNKDILSLNVVMPETDFDTCSSILEGLSLASYTFNHLKSETLKEEPTSEIECVNLISTNSVDLARCHRALVGVKAVNYARDLVNGNADDITPQLLATTALDLANEHTTITTTVFDLARIQEEKMGLLLAVSRGSVRDPVFILVEYKGNPESKDITALVGKGVTYDTGGLNLKPTGSMETMKDDMAGAATVLGTIKAAAELGLKVNLLGVVVSTENAIGPNSYKPGDVFKSHAGKTVEIFNTDAEGRLILADALSYIQQHYTLSRILDFATLTGAILVALGEEAAGLFSNNDQLVKEIEQASYKSAERVWRMPLFPEYKEVLKSSIADIRNCGNRQAGACTAAMFLQQFIIKTPWAHLDIAGTAFISSPKHYHPTTATGFGIRLLIELLRSYET